MFKTLQRITYPVADLARARQWYRMVLDREPSFDSPFFVNFAVGDASLALVPGTGASSGGTNPVVAHWTVDDADAAYERLLACGAAAHTEPCTVMHNRAAKVVDPFGNVIGITSRPADPHREAVEHRPSESAMGVTLCRALAAGAERAGPWGRDDLAEIFLTEDRRKLLKNREAREYIIQKMVTPELYGYILARTAYLDQIFAESLATNTPQIVLLGAGYDSRAYRFRERIGNTRIFELDVRSTQERKRELLRRSNTPIPPQLTFVTVNFKTRRIEDALSEAGFDGNARTLFLWEGVTYYLTEETLDGTLDSIRRNSGVGSEVCFDYMTQRIESVYAGEPFQFCLDKERMPSFLSERGYALVEHLGPEEIERRFLTFPDASSSGKTLAFFHLARASVQA